MDKILGAGAALLMTTGMAGALGLDRSGQDITVLFEDGDHAELSFGIVNPSIDGEDLPPFSGDSGNVAEDYTQFALGYKQQVNDTFSLALILDQPYGADIAYPAGGSQALGGTAATLDSTALSLIGRYHVNDQVSFHGGLRYQRLSAEVTLDGDAYGGPPPAGLSGYNVQLDEDGEFGYVIGAAYERPDIALRVAVTYFSEITYELGTTENITASSPDTSVTAPQAVNLDFQTGIAQDTLLFGQVRWAEYSEVIVSPAGFAGATGGGSLTDIDDGFSYTLGIGRQFTDSFAGSISVNYEEEEDPLVSPLAPTNGSLSFTVGGAYTMDNVELSGGISYVSLGDAQPETGTPDRARADFTDNSAVGVGLQIATKF